MLKADASRWSIGGYLSQYNKEGILRPIAYFSAKNSLVECNYAIHNKEMLAIIKCVDKWDYMCRAVKHLTVYTNYKNLTYFAIKRKLNKRHVC